MKLRTEITLGKSAFEINHKSKILLIGSCFSENIGNLLKEHKLDSLSNPLGICYNPISISNVIQKYSNFKEDDFLSENGLHFNYQLHSKFNSLQKKEAVIHANKELKHQKDFLKESSVIFISFGSAWVHELIHSREIVNNCHKQPKANFRKRLLTLSEIRASLRNTVAYLNRITRKDIQLVFTVSPIRHIKDGIHENQISKSILQLAIHELCEEFVNCKYFPSYEIMLDDLRDYRFYESDLIHPNQVAIEYIWEKFSDSFFSERTKSLNKQIQGFNSSFAHRPFNPNSTQHQFFIKRLIQDLSAFQEQENIDYQVEIEELKEQLLS